MAHLQCKRFGSYESEWKYRNGYGQKYRDRYGHGAFTWRDDESWSGDVLLIWLPDGIATLYVSTDPNMKHPERTVYHWDGDRESPTLHPSISNPPDGWHGWLNAGRLISV